MVVLTRGGRMPPGHEQMLGPRPMCWHGAGKLELAVWNPEREGDWMKCVEGADAVIHLAGAGIFDERWTPERKEVIWSSRVRSTELLSQAIASASKRPKVFISGSAIGHYGLHCGEHVVAEEDTAGDDFLARLTSAWEAAAEPARAAGVRVCHPRTGIVLGTRGGILAKMLPAFRAYMGGPIGDGRQYVAWIHIVDCVRAFEHAMEHESFDGAFNVTAPEPVTMNDFAHKLGEALERPSHVRVPALAVKLAIGEGAEAILCGQRAVPRRLVSDGFAFVFPEVTSALADLVSH